MTKTTPTNTVKVKIDIQPGLASPAQKQAWKRFWQKLITEARTGNDSPGQVNGYK